MSTLRAQDQSILSATASLKQLVTIISGLATTTAVVKVIAETAAAGVYGARVPTVETILMFAVAILTIGRFYHGNVRHLDEEYIGRKGKAFVRAKRVRVPTRVAADFVVIFFEALMLSIMSYFVGSFHLFVTMLAVLLLFDAIWFFFFHSTGGDDDDNARSKTWAANNLFFGLLFGGASAWLFINAVDPTYVLYVVIGFTVLALLNGAIDVVQEFDLYFPSPSPNVRRIFVAAPFTAATQAGAGIPHSPFRSNLALLIDGLKSYQYKVFNSHIREDWGHPDTLFSAERALPADLRQLENSDLLVALLTDVPSPGVQLEIGAALARGLPIIQIRHSAAGGAVEVPYLNRAFEDPDIREEFDVYVIDEPDPNKWAQQVHRVADTFRRRNR